MIRKNNSLRFKLALTIMWVNIAYLMVTFSVEYINKAMFYNYGSLENYFNFILQVFATNVFPLTVVYFTVFFLLLGPLQAAYNHLQAGTPPDDKLQRKARKNILNMPRSLLIANLTGYIIGTIIRLYTEYGYQQLDSINGWLQVGYAIAVGSTLSLIQISINNLILVKPKKLFKLYNLDLSNGHEKVSGIRIFWVCFFLCLNAIFYLYDTLKVSYDEETKYTAVLESVIRGETTLQQAEALYREEAAKMLAVNNDEKKATIGFPLAVSSLQRKTGNWMGIFFISFLVILTLTLGTLFFSVKDLLSQIVHVKHKMGDIIKGEGDLTTRMIITEKDAIGRLIDTINRFMEKFRLLLLKIVGSTKSVAIQKDAMENALHNFVTTIESIMQFIADVNNQTSSQIEAVDDTKNKLTIMLDNFSDISNNIDNLASFVQQTSTSMEQMGASINSVAQIAQQVNGLSGNLVQATDIGREKVDATIDSIRSIGKASEQVEEIVSMITDISGKTNMLSMNASIEAAHAGDAGRGFAVVANEIRNLAEESTESARRVSNIIEDISQQISGSVNLAEETDQALGEIYRYIDETINMINAISHSMTEQNAAVKDIISTVVTVMNTTRQTKQLTDEQMEQSKYITVTMDKLIRVSDTVHQNARQQEERNKLVKDMIVNIQTVMKKNTEEVDSLENELKKFKLVP